MLFTKSKGFSPIPTAPTIIQCGVACTRTHFSCRQSGEVDVCPFLFNGLAMGSSHTRSVIEGITDLTSCSVGGQVELGHEGSNGETRQVNLFVAGFETFVEIDGPFAGDVVGNFDVPHLAALEILGHNKISVDITVRRLAWLFVHRNGSIPFTALQVSDSGREDKTVARANGLNDTSCQVVLPSSACVCLVDSMKFTTTSSDLKPSLG